MVLEQGRGHSEKQFSHNAMVSVSSAFHSRCSLKTLFSQGKVVKPVNNVKMPSGSFGGPWTASYAESLGKRRNFGPK